MKKPFDRELDCGVKFKPGDFVTVNDAHFAYLLEGTVTEIVKEYENELGTITQVLRIAWSPFVSDEQDNGLSLVRAPSA